MDDEEKKMDGRIMLNRCKDSKQASKGVRPGAKEKEKEKEKAIPKTKSCMASLAGNRTRTPRIFLGIENLIS